MFDSWLSGRVRVGGEPFINRSSLCWRQDQCGERLKEDQALDSLKGRNRRPVWGKEILRPEVMSPKILNFLCFSEVLKLLFGVRSWAEMLLNYVYTVDVL